MVPEVEGVALMPLDSAEVAEALRLLLQLSTLCRHHQALIPEVEAEVGGPAMVEIEGSRELEEWLHKYSNRNRLRVQPCEVF